MKTKASCGRILLTATLLILSLDFRLDPHAGLKMFASASFIFKNLSDKRFAKLADINIGVLTALSKYDRSNMCSDQIASASIHYSQVSFFLKDILQNAPPPRLPPSLPPLNRLRSPFQAKASYKF
jgi:hypothetical protein